jgi:ABC-2 type transport system ATP-binding protein
MSQPTISLKNLTMRYGATTALDQVSFDAHAGDILGLLGPNGAGKTTLMRLITTYLYPSDGTATIAGYDVITQPLDVRQRIGYLPETTPLYPNMQVGEYLYFIGDARGLPRQRLIERLTWVQDACGVHAVWKHALSDISKGYRQRVGLAQALIHDPDVLILDEPTSGLDPMQILSMRALIRALARDKTIIFSTHILQEVEAMADRIAIINQGELVAHGTCAEITQQAEPGQLIRIAVRANAADVRTALRALPGCDEVKPVGTRGRGVPEFLVCGHTSVPMMPLVDELIKAQGWPLRHLAQEGATLEAAFLALIRAQESRDA